MKKLSSIVLALTMLLSLCACGGEPEVEIPENLPPATETYAQATHIALSDEGITVAGQPIGEDSGQAVYMAHDIVYYEAGKDFTYGEGTETDAHTAEEAAGHTVVHITRPGEYLLTGQLSAGQIAVDLGKDAETDPEAVVTLILGGADITCTVAPAVIFYEVYECSDKDPETAAESVDTSAAGANVILADGTENVVRGSYVARIYKSVELNEEGTEVVGSKKLHKYDGAFYSRQSMNVSGGQYGNGALEILAENEGLDTECHLTINGGNLVIRSGNDGINTNEDEVSVVTINGGTVDITVTGATGEGDGIDSNGWLVVNGGNVIARACGTSMDSGLDSDMGISLNGGTVIAAGNMLDKIDKGDYTLFRSNQQLTDGVMIDVKNEAGEVLGQFEQENRWSLLLVSGEVYEGAASLWVADEQIAQKTNGMGEAGGFGGGGGMRPGGEPPEGFEGGKLPEGFEGRQPPEGFEGGRPPEGFDPNDMPEGLPGRQLPADMTQPNKT